MPVCQRLVQVASGTQGQGSPAGPQVPASDNGVPRPGAAPSVRGAVGIFHPQIQLHCWDLFFRAEYHSGRMVRSVTIRSSSGWRGSEWAAPRALPAGAHTSLPRAARAPVRVGGAGRAPSALFFLDARPDAPCLSLAFLGGLWLTEVFFGLELWRLGFSTCTERQTDRKQKHRRGGIWRENLERCD